jgi:hypothetical protein
MTENVIPLRATEQKTLLGTFPSDPNEPNEPSLAMLMATIEEMDRGIKLMIGVIAEQDKRIRYLELQERKAQRKNMPVIVNSAGRPLTTGL